jgi:Holliday junction resolvase
MANSKAKGSNAERELISMFWDYGWGAMRAAGSGSTRFPSPDILASNRLRRLAIECKFVSGDKKYFDKEEIEQLETFSDKFGAEAWIGVKFSRKDWHFVKRSALLATAGGMYLASLEICKEKGVGFENLVGVQKSI